MFFVFDTKHLSPFFICPLQVFYFFSIFLNSYSHNLSLLLFSCNHDASWLCNTNISLCNNLIFQFHIPKSSRKIKIHTHTHTYIYIYSTNISSTTNKISYWFCSNIIITNKPTRQQTITNTRHKKKTTWKYLELVCKRTTTIVPPKI